MGKITVNIQREDRLTAINNLSKAIYEVAKALTTPTQVTVNGCHFEGGNPAVNISASDVVDTETLTQETD